MTDPAHLRAAAVWAWLQAQHKGDLPPAARHHFLEDVPAMAARAEAAEHALAAVQAALVDTGHYTPDQVTDPAACIGQLVDHLRRQQEREIARVTHKQRAGT